MPVPPSVYNFSMADQMMPNFVGAAAAVHRAVTTLVPAEIGDDGPEEVELPFDRIEIEFMPESA